MSYAVKDLMRDLRAGKFTSIGCYPTYFITADGEALSHEAVRENLWQVARATRDYTWNSCSNVCQWTVVAFDVNWENETLTCAHTGKLIECAYPSDKPTAVAVLPLGSVATTEIDSLLAWAREQGTRQDCPTCGDRVDDLPVHMKRHARAAVGDEDNRGGAPRP